MNNPSVRSKAFHLLVFCALLSSYASHAQRNSDSNGQGAPEFVIAEFKSGIDSFGSGECRQFVILVSSSKDTNSIDVCVNGVLRSNVWVGQELRLRFEDFNRHCVIAPIWCSGSEHTILDEVRMLDFKLTSDFVNPLLFRVVRGKGYVYQKGRGAVVTPSGKRIELGGQ